VVIVVSKPSASDVLAMVLGLRSPHLISATKCQILSIRIVYSRASLVLKLSCRLFEIQRLDSTAVALRRL
jgi:hypothetical protein